MKTIKALRKELEGIKRRGSFTITVKGDELEVLLNSFKHVLDDEEKSGRTELADTLEAHALLKLYLGTIKSEEIEGEKLKRN